MNPKELQVIDPASASEAIPPLTMKQRQRQERETAILEQAERQMATEGYVAMTMDDLAARLGIATGTLYQHFASKEDLVVGVAINSADRQRAFIDAQDTAIPAFDRLVTFMRWRIERKLRDAWPDVEAVMYVVRSQSKQRPEMQAKMDRRDQAVAQLVDEAKAQGAIRAEVDTAMLVGMLLNGIGACTMARVVARENRTAEQLTDSLLTLLIDGIRRVR